MSDVDRVMELAFEEREWWHSHNENTLRGLAGALLSRNVTVQAAADVLSGAFYAGLDEMGA